MSKLEYPKKYSKSIDELREYSTKQQEKYFKKKARYLARKLLLKPNKAVENFQDLVQEKYECGYINEEEYKELLGSMSDAINDYSDKSASAIKLDLKNGINNMFGRGK